MRRSLMINEVLSDEILAIDAIFPETVFKSEGSDSTYVLRLKCPVRAKVVIELFLSFDQAYPVETPRILSASGITKPEVEAVLSDLAGIEVLFVLLSTLQEKIQKDEALEEQAPEDVAQQPTDWFVGEPVHDRKSIMIGRACVIASKTDLDAALNSINSNKDLQKATHPCIWACRYKDESGRLVKAHEDDGESAAGSRLAFLLEVTQTEQALVVVSRWYGGINLGPRRFHDILTAGRSALDLLPKAD